MVVSLRKQMQIKINIRHYYHRHFTVLKEGLISAVIFIPLTRV